MRTPATVFLTGLTSCVFLCLIGCGGYDVVETKELEKLKAAEAEVSRLKEENSQLRQQVATLKNIWPIPTPPKRIQDVATRYSHRAKLPFAHVRCRLEGKRR